MKLIGTAKPQFLILVPACVFPGVATAYLSGATFAWWEILIVFLGAVFAHIGVNVLNEYQDWKNGLDAKTEKTPFSGGSGTLQKYPELAKSALIFGICTTAAAAVVGFYFVFSGRLLLLAIGGVGILTVILYTPWIVKNPYVCLIAPGLGFGTCMVLGTHVALGAPVTYSAFLTSLVPFFLVNNLLLLNQYPDFEPDRSVGRRHLIIAFGRKTGIIIYGIFLFLTYASIGVGAAAAILPVWSLLGLVTLPFGVIATAGAIRRYNNIEKLKTILGLNVLVVNLTPVLLALGILLG